MVCSALLFVAVFVCALTCTTMANDPLCARFRCVDGDAYGHLHNVTLTFYANRLATRMRTNPIIQLHRVEYFFIDVTVPIITEVTCTNIAPSAGDVWWRCTSPALPPDLEIRHTEVQCEATFHDYPSLVLYDSCGLAYSVFPTRKVDHGTPGTPGPLGSDEQAREVDHGTPGTPGPLGIVGVDESQNASLSFFEKMIMTNESITRAINHLNGDQETNKQANEPIGSWTMVLLVGATVVIISFGFCSTSCVVVVGQHITTAHTNHAHGTQWKE